MVVPAPPMVVPAARMVVPAPPMVVPAARMVVSDTPIVIPAQAGIQRAAHRSALRTAHWAIL
ncbi:MAG: hypothetical protein OXE75_02470, partial [bacterium]|nr:hypothetical protein [bacterium]